MKEFPFGKANKIIFLVIIIFFTISPPAFAILLNNGNFESGTTTPVTISSAGGASALTGWEQWAGYYDPLAPVTTRQATFSEPVGEGTYSAFIDATMPRQGILQYAQRAPDWYTVSGWFYVTHGQATVGIAHTGGFWNPSTSPTTSGLNEWEYLKYSIYVPAAPGFNINNTGPVLMSIANNSSFYVDKVWLNSGQESTSPYAPIPEPSTILLLSSGLLSIFFRRKFGERSENGTPPLLVKAGKQW